MFEAFTSEQIDVNGVALHVRTGGTGPPLLLLHGYPQTHVMWHRVAPRLAQNFRVIAPDLRGYGASAKPPAGDDYEGYSKRTMARELVQLMAQLGFTSFALAGHDRGARVAYRMALDHPQVVEKLVIMDIIPTLEQFEGLGWRGSLFGYHWYFLAQPPPLPERLIAHEPELYLRTAMSSWAGDMNAIDGEGFAAYLAAFTPETIRASCDDYRAGARIDTELDRQDRDAGRRITCPVLALWGEARGPRPEVLETWQRWADDVRGRGLPCGHFLPEEAPDQVTEEMLGFLR
jgi:haloacetate dehalogenase